ncbi:MAG: hypothetical protein HY040_17955 [Planctomycetes bacterium]|nr:hypothetical protein [Planctomycetota bacterium]
MAWPLSQDYNEAIQNPDICFADDELRHGQAAVNALGLPLPRSGNFADVYELTCLESGNRWAIKCFTREIAGLKERYQEISKYVKVTALPFTVDFQYQAQGIRVNGKWFPILKMRWVEGLLLNEFVRQNLDKKPLLEALSDIWRRMIQWLRKAQVAHGDLQHGNIILVPGLKASSLAVKLIDYDGMILPALARIPSGEVGHPAYQHPQRARDGIYNLDVDRFAGLSIYIALQALRVGGASLWNQFDNGDNFLFRESDLNDPGRSDLFKTLWAMEEGLDYNLVGQLVLALVNPIYKLPVLEDLLANPARRDLSAEQVQQVEQLLGVKRPVKAAPPAIVAVPLPEAVPLAPSVTPLPQTPVDSLRPRFTLSPRMAWSAMAAAVCCVLALGIWALVNLAEPVRVAELPKQKQKVDPPDQKDSQKPIEKPVTPNTALGDPALVLDAAGQFLATLMRQATDALGSVETPTREALTACALALQEHGRKQLAARQEATLPDPRRPLPKKSVVDAQNKALAEKFGKDLEKPLRADQETMSATLFKVALKLKDPDTRYAYLAEARQQAVRAENLELAWKIIRRLEDEYQMDALESQMQATIEAAKTDSFQTREQLLANGLRTAERLLQRGDVSKAKAMVSYLDKPVKLFKNQKPLVAEEFERLFADIGNVAKEEQKLKWARDALVKSPKDMHANHALGLFCCLELGDWQKGVPLLAMGDDSEDPFTKGLGVNLKALASTELSGLVTTKDALALAEGWYSVAKKSKSLLRQRRSLEKSYFWHRSWLADLKDAQDEPPEAIEKIEKLLPHVKELFDDPASSTRWDHLDLGAAKLIGNFIRLRKDSDISVRHSCSGPIEITIVARLNDSSFRVHAFNKVLEVSNRAVNSDKPNTGKNGSVTCILWPTSSPGEWHSLKWRISDNDMEVRMDDAAIFSAEGSNPLKGGSLIFLSSGGASVDVRSFTVKRLQ